MRNSILSRYSDWLRAGRSGIESRWGRDFPPVQTDPGAYPASCTMGTGSFPGVKCGRGVLLTTHPFLVPRSWKSRAIPLLTLWATPDLLGEHFTFTLRNSIHKSPWEAYNRSSCPKNIHRILKVDYYEECRLRPVWQSIPTYQPNLLLP